jgi:hypothetical protein
MMADHPPPAPRIEMLAEEIRTYDAHLHRAASDFVVAAVEIGKRLLQVRELLPHGQWLPWLREHFDWSEQTARNYMNAASGMGRRKLEGLAIEPSALYALTAPSADPEALDAAIRHARRGATITYSEARDLVRQHRPKSTTFVDLTATESREPTSVLDRDDTGVDPELDTAQRPLTSIHPPLALPEGISFSDDDDSPSVDELMRQAPPADDPLRSFTRPQSRWVLVCEGLRGFLDYEEELEEALAGRTVARLEPIWPAARRQRLAALLAEFRDALEAAP